jgi:hypothetical protein
MTMTNRIDRDARVVRIEFHSNPSFAEAEPMLQALVREPAYEPGFGFLVDRRSTAPPSADYVRSLAAFFALHEARFAGCRWALLVSNTTRYETARITPLLRADLPVHVEIFDDVEAAEVWLRDKGGSEG